MPIIMYSTKASLVYCIKEQFAFLNYVNNCVHLAFGAQANVHWTRVYSIILKIFYHKHIPCMSCIMKSYIILYRYCNLIARRVLNVDAYYL
jgi:hypothetical protein